MFDKETIHKKIKELFRLREDNKSSEQASYNHSVTEYDSVIALIDEIISEAIQLKASDIHLEPFEEAMSVRYRLDGVLKQKRLVKKEFVAPIVSRIKIMSGLDIAEKRRPQDGRIRFKYNERTVDIRVSTLPTDFGEKIVLRLLDKATLRLDLNNLGFEQGDLELFKEKIKLPNGIILITGPTGSGKTTTLYAALNYIKSPGINITTIEDPIEYNLEGINQTQIKPEINLTFGSALRAILRQDPNVVMVGEIRDRETLDNALRASLTGHLVLSTLHTNDAVSTIARLIDLGAERFLLSTSIKSIMAQRLVRLICPLCKTEEIDSNEMAAAKALGVDSARTRMGKGCDGCLSIGFKGRTAIYEMLIFDNHISNALVETANRQLFLEAIKKQGMSTLRDKGIQLVRSGVTTPSEVLRETC